MKRLLLLLFVAFTLLGCGIDSKEDAVDNTATKQAVAKTESQYDYAAVPAHAEYIFIASHDGNLDDYKHKALELLKNYVEANSNGIVAVKIFPNGQLASTNENMDGIIQKSLDIVNTTSTASLYWEPLSVFDLPYMVTDDRVVEEVSSSPEFVRDLRAGALEATKNARLMVITNSGRWRNFATVNKQIKNVNDLSGLKIRTVPSKVQQQLVSELGASPTGIAWGEVYTSLSTGVVDGTKNGLVDIVNAKLHESLNYVILDGHAYMYGFWWVNNEKFKSMPVELQTVMVDGFDAMSWFIREYNKYAEANSFEVFKKTGGTIYRPSSTELREFQERAKGVQGWFKENSSVATIEWLERYKAEIAKQEKLVSEARRQEIQ